MKRGMRRALVDRAAYRSRWSALHGGYDPRDSAMANGWLTLVETVARPVARRPVSPDAITLAGLVSAGLTIPAVLAGGRWRWGAAAAVVGSAAADSLDGAVAVLTDEAGGWGYLLDSLADRVADACFLVALRGMGAPLGAVLPAAGGISALEYSRARAGNAGYGDIALVTVGERPARIVVTAGAFVLAARAERAARPIATAAAVTLAAMSAVGAVQFLQEARRSLRQPQAGPISAATAAAESATSGSPPPG